MSSAHDVDGITIDAHNGLADVPAHMGLAAIARALAARGYTLPWPRPLPSTPLVTLAARFPFVVDALLHSADVVVGGHALQTPTAPRHAAGPSLLHTVAGPFPLGRLHRARLRIAPTGTLSVRYTSTSLDNASAQLQRLSDAQQAWCVLATPAADVGVALQVWTGRLIDDSAPLATRVTVDIEGQLKPPPVRSLHSIHGGDRVAVDAAFAAGDRVLLLPTQQRAAVLSAARPGQAPALAASPREAAAHFAAALRRSP